MGDLLIRRRELILDGNAPLPEWDYEWDYTKGLPTATGWTKETLGTTTEAIESTYLKVTVKGASGNYIRYKNNDYLVNKGVIEVQFKGVTSNNIGFRVSISNGTSGLAIRHQYSSSYKGIYLLDNATFSNCTKLVTSSSATTTYTVRLEIDNGVGQVYINDSLKASDVDLSTIVVNNNLTMFQFNESSTGTVTGRFYHVRLKLNRTS